MIINNIIDFKKIVGGTPANNDFENFAPSVEDAKNFVIPFIGEDAYNIAEKIEHGEQVDIEEEMKAPFLFAVQKPVAWKAIHDYVPEGNVLFDNTGIHVQKSNDNQTAAKEWHIVHLQQSYHKKAYNSLNELLVFLDKNREKLPFWKNSAAEKQRQGLFVQTPNEFSVYFDIKGSFALFVTIAPEMLNVQRNRIRAALGRELYNGIVTKWKDKTDFSEHEKAVFEAAKPVVVYLALANKIRTLPAALLPDGIVEYFSSDYNAVKSSMPLRLEMFNQLYEQLIANYNAALSALVELLADDDEPQGTGYVSSERGFLIS